MVKIPKYLIAVFIAILIGICAISVIPTNASANPSGTLTHSPTQVYLDQVTTFSFSVTNTGGVGEDIWDLWVFFDWDASGTGYHLIGSTHVTIGAGATSPTYTVNVKIPQTTTGSHTYDVETKAQATGDWVSSSLTWDSIYLTVSTVPTLSVACSANPTSGAAPLPVTFSTTVTGGLVPYSYSWTFGDGSTSTLANPTHTYASAGSFSVTVVVTDTETTDQVKSATAQITVTAGTGGGGGGGGGGGSGASDSSTTLMIIAIIAVVVVVAIVVALVMMSRKKKSGGQGQMPPMQQPPMQQYGPPQNP